MKEGAGSIPMRASLLPVSETKVHWISTPDNPYNVQPKTEQINLTGN